MRSLTWAYVLVLAIAVLFGVVAFEQLHRTASTVESVVTDHADRAIATERLRVANEQVARAARSYLLTLDVRFRAEANAAWAAFERHAATLGAGIDDPVEAGQLSSVISLAREHYDVLSRTMDEMPASASRAEVSAVLEREVRPLRVRLDAALSALGEAERRLYSGAQDEARRRVLRGSRTLLIVASVALALAAIVTVRLKRTLGALAESREELEKSHRRLVAINEDLDAFAGRVAHDLRNALTPITLTADRLRRCASRPDDVLRIADRLGQVAIQSRGLVDALLAFARSGQPPERDAAAPVEEVLRDALAITAPAAEARQVSLHVSAEECSVRCTPDLLRTALVNVIGNAIKFLEHAPVRAVRVVVEPLATECRIAVEDTGPGIPVEAREQVFRPFYRVPGTKVAGTGIGLSTVARIVGAHGGRVSARSGEAGGTVIELILPRSCAPRAGGPTASSSPQ